MASDTGSFNVLLSIERHIQSLNPFQPKKAVVYIGKYATSKRIFNHRNVYSNNQSPIFLEKITYNDDQTINQISDLTPEKFGSNKIKSDAWYSALSTLTQNPSIIRDLEKQIGKPRVIVTVASIWDGFGSAILPTLNTTYEDTTSLSLVFLPSNQHEPNDYFNAYSSIKLLERNNQIPVLLLNQCLVESYQGLNQKGEPLIEQGIANYLIDFLCSRESLIQEFVVFSKKCDVFFFMPTILTGASYQIYGTIENIFKMALLKPLSNMNISSLSSVYAILRMPMALKEKIPKKTIEFALNQLFDGKIPVQQIQVADINYTKDAGDRIDALVLIGTKNAEGYFTENQSKIDELKNKALENGLITEDWQLVSSDSYST
jgi:hypothetical protein